MNSNYWVYRNIGVASTKKTEPALEKPRQRYVDIDGRNYPVSDDYVPPCKHSYVSTFRLLENGNGHFDHTCELCGKEFQPKDHT